MSARVWIVTDQQGEAIVAFKKKPTQKRLREWFGDTDFGGDDDNINQIIDEMDVIDVELA